MNFKIHLGGILIFLFIPAVLFLFLRFPLGIFPSFAIAISVMFLHRYIAKPYMNSFRNSRCLWCGKTSGKFFSDVEIDGISFKACSEKHQNLILKFCIFVEKYKIPVSAGIFVPLVFYIFTTSLIPFGKSFLTIQWERFIFHFFIALTVVSVSFLYRIRELGKKESPSFPFPVHNLFLLGIRSILWIFRIVGIWWICDSIYFLARNGG